MQSFLDKVRGAWRSKTVWFNAALLGMLPLIDLLSGALPQLQMFLTDESYRRVGIVTVVGNIVLRFLTSRPLEHK